jgi:hypothetical protein
VHASREQIIGVAECGLPLECGTCLKCRGPGTTAAAALLVLSETAATTALSSYLLKLVSNSRTAVPSSAGVLWVLPQCVQRAEAAAGFWLDSLAGLLSCGEVQQWEWLSIDVIWQCSCLLCTVDLVLVAREEQCTPYVRHYMMPRAAWCCQYAEPARVVVALGGR